jgi:hypothetical protein
MRGVILLALGLVALTVCVPLQAGTSSTTALRISYWEDGSGGKPDAVRTLQCNPARGTVVRPARACARLAAGGAKLFAPLPPNVVCTEIYGGPQKALVAGTVAGKRIWATFARTNGCKIDRWNRLAPWLLPPGGVT